MDFSTQLNTFLLIAATGILLGMLFDTYRVLRGYYRPPWLITSITDLLYWLVAAGIAFLALIMGNWGELRFYVFIAMFAGVAAYYRLASRHFLKMIIMLFKVAGRLWQTGKRMLVFTFIKPVRLIVRALFWPVRYTGRKCSDWYKKRQPPPPPPEEAPPP